MIGSADDAVFITLTREDLYSLVWSKPLAHLAPDFLITGTALANRCRRLRVPLPGRGYWAKVNAGHKPAKTRLPPARKGQPTSIRVRRRLNPPQVDQGACPMFEPVEVPPSLDDAHPFTRRAWNVFRRSKPGEQGYCDHPLDIDLPSVYTTHATLERALRLLEAIARSAESVGWSVVYEGTSGMKARGTRVDVGGVLVPILIEEERNYVPGSRTELRTNGRLRIELAKHDGLTGGTRQVWRDGKVLRLEDQLQDVMTGIWRCAQELAARKAVQDRREAEERARREALEAEEERRERERTWTEDLDERLKLLARGKAIRELLERLPKDVRASEWGRWLEAQAEAAEQLVRAPAPRRQLQLPFY